MRTSKPIARLAVLVALVACSSAVPSSSLTSGPSAASPGASVSPTAVPTPVPPPPPTAGPTAVPTPVPPPPPPPAVPTAVPTPVPPPPPVILAAGDIASGGAGSGASETALILQSLPGATVLTLGDNAYPDGTLSDFQNNYGPTWGIAKNRTQPAMGNHDYNCCPDAAGAGGYFGFGKGPLYYTYTLGTWKIIALDAGICYSRQTAACDAGFAQELWLKAQLATNPTACTLLYWHQARWSSGSTHGSDQGMKAFWDDAVAASADIVLNGHDHLYERFAPMDANGNASATGVREFVVGTGGAGLYGFGTPLGASQFRDSSNLGVLKLTLRVGAYDWAFLPVGGRPALDAGSGTCN